MKVLRNLFEAKPTPILNALKTANMVRLRQVQLRNPSINLTHAFDCIIKAFQNPIWVEQARERLKQIRMLTKATTT